MDRMVIRNDLQPAMARPATGGHSADHLQSTLRRTSLAQGFRFAPAIRNPRSPRGLTLLELLVTMTIFLFMAGMLIMIIQQTTQAWARGERERLLLERASGALDRLANDLSLACGQDPIGVDTVQARFFGDFAADGSSQIKFARSFEAGPERALTMTAGDGRKSDLRLRPLSEEDDKKPGPGATGPVDKDSFTGTALGDYRAIGGMAQVAWFVQNQTLYRNIRAPIVPDGYSSLIDTGTAAVIAEDTLYFDVEYWHQATSSWDQTDKANGKFGPERIWDSTRGITAKPLNSFILHRGVISINDPEDDVFPSKVRITLTVDSPMPRCVTTKLTRPLTDNDDRIHVQSVRGFPAGGTPDACLLIDKEWIRYKNKVDDTFIIAQRGARGSTSEAHDEDAVVRVGRTFTRTVFLRNYREDWTSDKEYFAKKQQKP
jgi:prepilin-type N-terminal cleavage/methylation domain-containing protein